MHVQTIGFRNNSGLSVVQLATSGQDSFDYVSCGRGIADGLIEVKEVNDAGSVNTIFVLNTSDKFVFLMDGDIFAGAKQNRVVNTSMLLSPKSKTQIPVSCVEHGRWQHTSAAFRGTDYAAPMSLRADKARQVRESLRDNRGFSSNQGEIWNSVSKFHASHKVASPTSNLSDIFEEKAEEFDHMVHQFTADPNANGMAVFFGKNLASLDIFNRKEIFAEYFPKMIRAAAFEARARRTGRAMVQEAEARYRTLELLDSVEQQAFDERKGAGTGTDRRFESPDSWGFELVYDEHLIHLAVFRREHEKKA